MIDLVYAETQAEQLRELMRKWDDHKAMVERMSEIIRRYGLRHDAAVQMTRTLGVERVVAQSEEPGSRHGRLSITTALRRRGRWRKIRLT